jgi:hypothetical protein
MGYSGPVSHKFPGMLCLPPEQYHSMIWPSYCPLSLFPGGETEALKRMKEKVTDRPLWACEFKKPETSPNSLEPSTTVRLQISVHDGDDILHFAHTNDSITKSLSSKLGSAVLALLHFIDYNHSYYFSRFQLMNSLR